MNKQVRLFGGVGLLSFLIMGAMVSNGHADGACHPKSPLRGAYVLNQVGYVVPGVPGATVAGTITVDECGNTTGHGVFNVQDFSGVEFDWTGPCVLRPSGYEADCTLNGAAGRYCVLTRNDEGCVEKWHCINSNEAVEPGMVIMADIERVHAGTCK